jgi:enediyne biosynthesis protein E4
LTARYVVVLVLLLIVTGGGSAGRPARTKAAATLGVKPSNVRFTDVTASAGITFRSAAAAEDKYIVTGGGVLLLDYDRDGWLDIYFTNAPTVNMYLKRQRAKSALYRNNRDGTFSDVTDAAGVGFPCWAMGGAAADIDNDGWPDIYVTCLGRNVLLHNQQNGTFIDIAVKAGVADERWSTGAAFGDYDNDGLVDLFVSNYVDLRLTEVSHLDSAKTCPYRGLEVQCGPRGLRGAGDSLYHNNGNVTFTDVSQQTRLNDPHGYFGLGAIWTDLDDDGRIDLFVANDATPNFLYHNLGSSRFEEIGFESGTALSADGSAQAGMGVTVCDYLHTGRLSLYVTNFADEYNTLYRNDGKLAFTDVTYVSMLATPTVPYLGWGTACTDFDHDGWSDLFVVNGHVYPQAERLTAGQKYRQRMLFFTNQRDGTFRDDSSSLGLPLTVPHVSRGAAFGDLDNDGDTDAVVENLEGLPTILRNDSAERRHWITLELIGTRSNRMAIGAKVKVIAGPLVQIDEVRSGSSYLSQNDMRLHFGVDAQKVIDRVEIRWPSGVVETIRNVIPNKFYTVREGSGAAVPWEPASAIKSK